MAPETRRSLQVYGGGGIRQRSAPGDEFLGSARPPTRGLGHERQPSEGHAEWASVGARCRARAAAHSQRGRRYSQTRNSEEPPPDVQRLRVTDTD